MSNERTMNVNVVVHDAEKIGLEFVEYMSIDDRPYAHESEYIQFERWLE